MKRIYIVVLIILIFTLSACQPTPDEQVITQKDDIEELIQKTASPEGSSAETLSSETEKPAVTDEPQPTEEPKETYKETLEFEDSAFKVIIDAVIDKPDGPIPVAKVEPNQFAQEDSNKALELFMPNQTIYEFSYDSSFAKETFQQQIIELNTLVAKISSDTTLDEHTRRALIDYYNGWIDHLNGLSSGTPTDLQIWEQVENEFTSIGSGVTGLSAKADMGKVWPAQFEVAIFDDRLNSALSFTNEGSIDNRAKGVLRISDDIKGLKTTFLEAQKLAEETMKQLDVENMKLDYAELGTYGDVQSELIESEYIPKSYMFCFTCELNGIQERFLQICKGFEQEGSEYDSSWGREFVQIIVDDTGVVGYAHTCPGEITEIVNDNAEVLDFDEAMEIFRKQIFFEGVWTGQGITFSDLNITKIQLNMFRLRLKEKNEYMYVPVWDFIGTWETDNYGTEPGKEFCFLTINAINGSIINRNLGY